MALFRRPVRVVDTAPDSTFPFWSASDADRFRQLVRVRFAKFGVRVDVHAGGVTDPAGTPFDLADLAATCHQDPRGRRGWTKVIDRHIRGLLDASAADPFATLRRDEIFSATYLRLMPSAEVLPSMSYARNVAPGLAEVLAVDLPASVHYLTDEHVAAFALADLRAAGLANLRAVVVDAHRTLDDNGGTVEVLLGESSFIGSLLLVLDEVVARYGYRVDPDVGVLVAAPNRNQLDFHVPSGPDVVASLHALATFALAGYRDAPGRLSPDAFWWRPEAIERVAASSSHGITSDISPQFAQLLNRMSAARRQ